MLLNVAADALVHHGFLIDENLNGAAEGHTGLLKQQAHQHRG